MSGIPASLEALAVPIADLRPYARNPRNGDTEAIAESLRVNGQYRPVVVNSRTNEVLAGNHTLHAALELGWEKLAVTFVDADDEQAARIVLVDNRTSDLAVYDDGLLADLLADLPDLEGTGFDQRALDDLLARLTELPTLDDPDSVPALPKQPRTELGDVWLLGPHRVVCGDSTDVGVLDVLMAGALADCVWTDPPYGVDYVGGNHEETPAVRLAKGGLTIDNDGGGLEPLLQSAFAATFAACKPGAAWYVAFADRTALPFVQCLTDLGIYRHLIVWVKDSLVLGRGDYHARHEQVAYGWHPGAPRLHPVSDRSQDTVWEIPRPKSSREHPTMKPVALVERALENSTGPGWTVLDPFAGSGSTLIACHLQGRVARLVELDPRYVDVICRRYQEATGDKPVLEATGEPHDFTA